jgi:hypothetical protein
MNGSGFKSFLDNNIADRSDRKKRRLQLIDWTQIACFYEDSEGDMNVISEDEDLVDAFQYFKSKQLKTLELSIVDKSLYK